MPRKSEPLSRVSSGNLNPSGNLNSSGNIQQIHNVTGPT